MLAALAVSRNSFASLDDPLGDGPRWACWYSPKQVNIQCLLIQVPTQGLEQRAAEVASHTDRRLPKVVRQIWGSPEQLAGTHISIPLMAPPFEMSLANQLARSVICGSRKDCSILFDRNADGYAPIRAAALESGSNEADVLAEMAAQGLAVAQLEAPAPQNRKRRRG